MSAKNSYENKDEHRFRNVAVWLIPIVFSVLTAIAFSAYDARVVIWSTVLAVIIFLGYALFLLEWYVWTQDPARKRARIAFTLFCALAIIGGIVWQLTAPPKPQDSITVHLPPGFKLGEAIKFLAQQESFTATFGAGCDSFMQTEVEEADLAGGSIVALIELLPRHLKKPPPESAYRVVRIPEKGIYEITCAN